jgi:2-iminobutanoate/2-iminopropanoate deaminase
MTTGRPCPSTLSLVNLRPVDAPSLPAPIGGYTNALEVTGAGRLLFISGQIPVTADDQVPADFEAQCRLVWAHIRATLDAAGMGISDLVKVTTYLSDRTHADVNGVVRQEVLGDHRPALTVLVAGIYDPSWLLEIEAVAAI